MMDNNLFTKVAFDDLKLDFVTKERVIRETFVTIDGQQFEVEDLYETINMIESGNAYVTDYGMGKMLVKYGVLSSAGSMNWPGSIGPNYEAFVKMLEKH